MSINENKNVANDVIEMVWKNSEYCSALVPVADFIEWCGSNDSLCIHKHDLLQRLIDNYFQMAMIMYEMFHIVTRDKLCENQT